MTDVKYSPEFNAKQVLKRLEENNSVSCALVTTRKEEGEIRTLAAALAAAAEEKGRSARCLRAEESSSETADFTVVYGANLLKNADAVLACEKCDSVILVEKYGVSSHRKVDEATDLLRVQKSNVLGVIALK